MKTTLLLFILVISFSFYGQNQTFSIHPNLTDANYDLNDNDNTITINTVSQNNKLFLFLGGTGTNTTSYNALINKAADIGYDVINLSYYNSTAAASLSGNSDSLVFNKFRQELCFGTTVSGDISIDTLHSIYQRTVNLLNYLSVNYPAHNWSQYLNSPTTLNWDKIAVGGHSQGSGHAAYLAKYYNVNRVLMFSGPNDYHNIYLRSANWLRTPGVTPYYKHYSYLSLNDETVDYAKQLENIIGLGMFQGDDSTYIDNLNTPYGFSRCLYTTQPPTFVIINHNVTTKNTTINQDVWYYMLTDESSLNAIELSHTKFKIYPNPANNILHLQIEGNSFNKDYSIIDLQGKTILSGKTGNETDLLVPIDIISSGSYIFKLDTQNIPLIIR